MKSFFVKRIASIFTVCGLLLPPLPAQTSQEPSAFTIRVTSELVLVNVVARDGKGNLVRGLGRDDFTVLEDERPQVLSSFDFEEVETGVETTRANAALLVSKPEASAAPAGAANPVASPLANVRNHRLIVLFFDSTSMQPAETERAIASACDYVNRQMAPSDLVAVVSLSSLLHVDQDFTSDRAQIERSLQRLSSSSNRGYEQGPTGTTEGMPDTGQPFTADETEYNIFNTNRKFKALQSLAQSLAGVKQKKSIIYFSSGVARTGMENQSALRAAIDAAVKANVAIYPTDMRGLQALPPGGEAQQASLRGVTPYSGQSVLNQLSTTLGTQETLVTLAGDTGGRAFLNSNDFAGVFDSVQKDTSAYYVLGYYSNNPARDGHFRRITVRIRRSGLKLEHRVGYYGARDFKHSTHEDREEQLRQELASDLPAMDLTVLLSAGYFRQDANTFFVPVSLVVPGADIPFTQESNKNRLTLDVLGEVLDEAKHAVGRVRDTVALSIEGTEQIGRKNIQYGTGFTLGPGTYKLKFVVRENQTGKIGSFETDLTIPDLRRAPLKMSSVITGSQMKGAPKRKTPNPLVRNGNELIPSVARIFTPNQHLYFYYEVYDPRRESMPRGSKGPEGNASKDSIRLFTNISCFNGQVKTYETPLTELKELNLPERGAAVFQFDVLLSQLKPGFYTCQVNVVDDVAGTFLFPRIGLAVRR